MNYKKIKNKRILLIYEKKFSPGPGFESVMEENTYVGFTLIRGLYVNDT